MTAKTMTFDRLGNEVAEAGRDLWRAGLGAAAEIGSEAREIFDTLVERGEEFEKRQVRPRQKQYRKRLEGWRDDLRDRFEEAVAGALHRFGVPTREDFEALSARLEDLSSKIDRMAATR